MERNFDFAKVDSILDAHGRRESDLIAIMLEYGAINAINMDGGSSSLIYYKGEYLNRGVSLTGSRNMPTAFIVR